MKICCTIKLIERKKKAQRKLNTRHTATQEFREVSLIDSHQDKFIGDRTKENIKLFKSVFENFDPFDVIIKSGYSGISYMEQVNDHIERRFDVEIKRVEDSKKNSKVYVIIWVPDRELTKFEIELLEDERKILFTKYEIPEEFSLRREDEVVYSIKYTRKDKSILYYEHNFDPVRIKNSIDELFNSNELVITSFFELSWNGNRKSAYIDIEFKMIDEKQFNIEIDNYETKKIKKTEKHHHNDYNSIFSIPRTMMLMRWDPDDNIIDNNEEKIKKKKVEARREEHHWRNNRHLLNDKFTST